MFLLGFIKQRNAIKRLMFVPALSILLCCSHVSHAIPVTPAKPSAAAKEGWRLSYKLRILGRLDCTVTKDGAKLTSPVFSLLVLPPDWKATVYNPQTKKMKTLSEEQLLKSFARIQARSVTDRVQFTPWEKQGKEVVCGLHCTKFQRVMVHPKETKTQYSKFIDQYWVTKDLDSVEFKQLLLPLSSLAFREYKSIGGLPVKHRRIFQVYNRGSKTPFRNEVDDFLVLEETNKVSVKPSFFAVPKNFQIASDESEVMFGATFEGSDGNLFGDN